MQENRPRNVEVVGHGVKAVKLVHAVGHGVGERVLLGVDDAGLDPVDRLGQIHAQRHAAEQREGARLDLARQHADAHVLEVRRRVHGAQAVRDLAEAVLEPAEDAVVHALLDLVAEKTAERAVHRGARLVALLEQERQIDEAELRHAIGQIARRLVAEREHAVLDQPEDIFGAIAEIHDVPDILHVDPAAELRR